MLLNLICNKLFDNIRHFYDSNTIIVKIKVVSLCSKSNILMKLIYIILLLASIVTNEVLLDILLFQDHKVSLYENPIENQPEKENQDNIETETEIDYFTGNTTYTDFTGSKVNAIINHHSSSRLIPYLEIHSPPPE
ncbi:MAG: hypothetical protein ACI8P3_000724 [Saprospiraceae bacterium]|jgi:hypothetical protein